MKTSNYKILIADDEKDVREILKYNISIEGYKVFTAENGEEALKLIKAKTHILLY